jgi:hypothetical protein
METAPAVKSRRSLLMAKKPESKKPWAGSPADEEADKKVMKGMKPKQKAAFKAADKKMDKKKPGKKEDLQKDAALAKKIKGSKK